MSTTTHSCCGGGGGGPGYASPLEAVTRGPREKVLYIPCITTRPGIPNYLATIDVDPESSTYSTVVHRTSVADASDELHHTGWNACSSCHNDPSRRRRYLIAPSINTGNISIFDTLHERAPVLCHTVSGADIKERFGLTWPHTTHCLPTGQLMVSYMGDGEGEGGCGAFMLIQSEAPFEPVGRWSSSSVPLGYDYWYQPRQGVMVSSEFGAPRYFRGGFNPADVSATTTAPPGTPPRYGRHLHLWDWHDRRLLRSVDLGLNGLLPLEVRFLHDPSRAHGYVGAALSSTIIHFYRDDEAAAPTDAPSTLGGESSAWRWVHKTVIRVPPKHVTGWMLPEMPSLITDILISLDDRFLYFSNWLHGDVRQYDISDPHSPKLVGQVFIGGLLQGGDVKVVEGLGEGDATPASASASSAPEETRDLTGAQRVTQVRGKKVYGGPQMLQLSLDGKRLYVSTSLLSTWDAQFYPSMVKNGASLVVVEVDNATGGLKVKDDFMIQFGEEPDGPVLAHEARYPGGDCSSDIWI